MVKSGGSTEDTVTDLLADYLRQKDIDARTQISVSLKETRRQPDLEIRDGGKFFGEAEWEKSKWLGLAQARDFGLSAYATGSFLITYDERLADVIKQTRLTKEIDYEVLFSGYKFSCIFMIRDRQTDIRKLTIKQIPNWIKENIELQPPKIDSREIINTLRQGVDLLRPKVEEIENILELFKSVLGSTDIESEKEIDKKIAQVARNAAAYLLLNQIVFYRILAEQKGYEKIIPENINSPRDFIDYFSRVEDYTPVFGLHVASRFIDEPSTLDILRTVVKAVDALKPEHIGFGVLGTIYHTFIPIDDRKPVAAYYTLEEAAKILAYLSIDNYKAKVIDPACGSGTLLGAAYSRKKELYHDVFIEKLHKKFLEEDITGVDIMPFAAHLSVINLALKSTEYESDRLNIAIWDSTTLKPGKELKPLAEIPIEARKQRRIVDFEKTISKKEKVSVGSVKMDAKPGEIIHLNKVDTVIMNPPFTRQETITKFSETYKSRLEKNFLSRKHLLHGRMSYCSYFLFLADKFLDVKGRIAAVLPATVLMKESDFGIRKMLMDEYGLDYIILRSDAPNFSEDTDLREILLVAQKGKKIDNINYVILRNIDIHPSKIKKAVSKLEIGMESDFGEYLIRNIPISELDRNNLFKLISVQNFDLFKILESVEKGNYICSINKSSVSVTRGVEGGKRAIIFPKFSINEKGAPYLKKKDVWIFKKQTKGTIVVQHRFIRNEFEIPINSILPNLRRISGRDKIDVSKLKEYLLTDSFDEIDSFLNMVEENEIPSDWKSYLLRRKSHLCFVCRFDMGAPGTHHLGFYSDVERVFPGVTWVLKDLTKDNAKIVSLWLNSSFNVLQVLVNRMPTRGTWMEFTGYLLNDFKVLDPKKLKKKEKEDLLKVFNKISKLEFPSIVEQLAMNVNIKDMKKKESKAFEETYSFVKDKVGIGFAPRREIDTAILKVLGFKRKDINAVLDQLYISLLRELKILTDMMKARPYES